VLLNTVLAERVGGCTTGDLLIKGISCTLSLQGVVVAVRAPPTHTHTHTHTQTHTHAHTHAHTHTHCDTRRASQTPQRNSVHSLSCPCGMVTAQTEDLQGNGSLQLPRVHDLVMHGQTQTQQAVLDSCAHEKYDSVFGE